uniref:Methyltransferase n=1 Tax=viral metagenome TaxID=1070528 RepID=A0A6C0D257_9ZZZZ
MSKLIDLIDNTKTDKNTCHSYIDTYERVLQNKKYNKNNVLEIGIGEPKLNLDNGGSIKLWYDYFPNSIIYALDICDISQVNNEIKNKERIKLLTSIDAYNEDFIKTTFIDKNIKFDILIDDGPHTKESMEAFIIHYFELLNPGGIMIIEDIPDIDWIQDFINLIPLNAARTESIDLRYIKERWDDIMLVIYKI